MGSCTGRVKISIIPKEDRESGGRGARHPEEFTNIKRLGAVPFPLFAGNPASGDRLIEPVSGVGPALEIGELMRVVNVDNIGLATGIEVGLVGNEARGVEAFYQLSHGGQLGQGVGGGAVSAAVQKFIF